MQQATRGGQQPVTPELEARARDEVVLREIFAQEAEKRGIAASADYRSQMELARQTHPDPRAVRRLPEEEPGHRRRSQGRVRQVQGPVQRHRVPRAPHPGREGRRGQGAAEADEGRRQVRRTGQEAQQRHGLRRQRRRPRLRQARRLRARVRPGHGRAEEGRDDRHAGEEPVRLAHHQARRHARGAVPGLRRSQGRRSSSACRSRRCSSTRKTCARRPRPTTSSAGSRRRRCGAQGTRRAYLTDTRTGMRRRPKPRSKRAAKCPAMRVPQCGQPPSASSA